MNSRNPLVEILLTENPELRESALLLALSGGVDSMVLADILSKAGIKFSAAHCNFMLRGKESDDDEIFVRDFCCSRGISFFSKKMDAEAFKKTGNYSTQMAARILRYNWFEELMDDSGFDFLLTAHHLDDAVETFLINLSRGTGLTGLAGMKRKSGTILRPLLSHSKEEIMEYAEKEELRWREDSSNLDDVYNRNKIRHHILPVLKELHPEFLNNFKTTARNLQGTDRFLMEYVLYLKSKLFIDEETHIRIPLSGLSPSLQTETALHYLFGEFGFNFGREVKKLISSKSNAEIQSDTHRLIKNRNELILTPLEPKEKPREIELGETGLIEKPVYLKVYKSSAKDMEATEVLDAENIRFPLKIRKKRSGDRFTPLGMKGTKKLSKFFKDEKFSKLEKEEAWLLTDNSENILYILGNRINDKFKLKENTREFLNIYLC